MKKNELKALESQLIEYFPGFTIKINLLVLQPVCSILRGVSFDRSVFDKSSFTVTAFIMPLCVSTNYLYFNFGTRIRHSTGGDRWNISNSDLVVELGMALKLQAIPFLSCVTSLLDFVEMAKTFSQANPNTRKAIAYSLARSGRIAEAVEILDQLLKQLDRAIPWQFALASEAERLKIKLTTHPKEAIRELELSEVETKQNLGL